MAGNDNAPGRWGVTTSHTFAGARIEAAPTLQGGTVTAHDRVLNHLRDNGKEVRETTPGKALAQCPAHDDHDPSLSIRRIEGQSVIYCHAGW
jgi:hypothetical protein